MFSLLNFCHVLGKSCDLFKIFLKSLLRIILFIFLIATCISLSLHCLYSYFSFRLSYLLMYWVGQKVRLGFSVRCYGKTQRNSFTNPILQLFYLNNYFNIKQIFMQLYVSARQCLLYVEKIFLTCHFFLLVLIFIKYINFESHCVF